MNGKNVRSIEEEKLALERFRAERELELKREELSLARERLKAETKRRSISPITATVFAALLGLIGTTLGVFLQGRSNTELERRKFELSLISRAFETSDQNSAANYLQFIAQTGLVEDQGLRNAIAGFVKKPDTIPSLPTTICENLEFDLATGTLNGLPATASQEDVKRVLPCWTGDTPDGSGFNYGGGVFFTNHNFYFYTGQDFIEVRSGFRGSVSPPLLGEKMEAVRSRIGEPRVTSDGTDTWYFEGKYGCLRLEFENGVVRDLAVHYKSCDDSKAYEKGD